MSQLCQQEQSWMELYTKEALWYRPLEVGSQDKMALYVSTYTYTFRPYFMT